MRRGQSGEGSLLNQRASYPSKGKARSLVKRLNNRGNFGDNKKNGFAMQGRGPHGIALSWLVLMGNWKRTEGIWV